MNLTPLQVGTGFVGLLAYFAVLFFVHRSLVGRAQAYFTYGAVIASTAIFFYLMQVKVPNHALAMNYTKLGVAVLAALLVMYEAYRKGQGRPIAERWKKFIGVTLAVAAIACYFNGFRFGYPRYYHRHDQYHYYVGAKYFPELRYTDMYKCAVVAQNEMGDIRYELDEPWGKKGKARTGSAPMRREMRDPDTKVRNLGGDNLLMPVREILKNPEECRNNFSSERWEEY